MPINYKLVQNLLRLIVIITALVLVVFILISKGSSANSSSATVTQRSNGTLINKVNPSNPYAFILIANSLLAVGDKLIGAAKAPTIIE